MTPAPGHDLGLDALAQHRHATILHTIPDRLDYAARLLDDALDLLARYGLAEARQPNPIPYRATVEGLRAAGRLRTAADAIPAPGRPSRPLPATSHEEGWHIGPSRR